MIFVAEQRCNFTFVYVVANVYLVCSKLQTWSIVLKVPVSMKHLVLSCTVLWTGNLFNDTDTTDICEI